LQNKKEGSGIVEKVRGILQRLLRGNQKSRERDGREILFLTDDGTGGRAAARASGIKKKTGLGGGLCRLGVDFQGGWAPTKELIDIKKGRKAIGGEGLQPLTHLPGEGRTEQNLAARSGNCELANKSEKKKTRTGESSSW